MKGLDYSKLTLAQIEDAARKDERANIAKSADKLLKRAVALVSDAISLHRDLANLMGDDSDFREADPVTAMTNGKRGRSQTTVHPLTGEVTHIEVPARKAPSPKLSADECATIVCAVINTQDQKTLEQIADMAKINREQAARGIKKLGEQKRVVCVNPEARRNRRYQLVTTQEETSDAERA